MLDRIIKFSLNNRLIILMLALLLTLAGTYTISKMDVDVFPDLNAPTVAVMTEAPGMAPEEVERIVTYPIETALNGATDVRRVRSSSTTGFSVVWIEFEWGTDIQTARQTVSEKLATVSGTLPANVGQPTMGPQSSILGEVMIIGLTSDTTSQQSLRTLADWTLRPRLLAVQGVAQVAVLGGETKEYQIQLDPQKMKHYGVTLNDALNATSGMNVNTSGGIINEYGNEYIVRTDLSTSDVYKIGRNAVKPGSPSSVCLDDIADITVGNKLPKTGMASERGKSAVIVTVTKQPSTSTLELTERLEQSLSAMQKELPADVKISTDIFRQSRFIESSISNVEKSLYEGAFFVVIILFLFLMNIRTTVISLISIPLSIITALVAIHAMGLTVNTMSLGGIAIAIGSLVDDAIVDVENVYKHLRENRLLPKSEQKPILKLVFSASREVRMPILNSTLIIIASFMPLFFLSGMEGRMLMPLGITFIISLFASTLVALTVTPVMCSYLLDSKGKEKPIKETPVVLALKSIYKRSLEWTLNHRKAVLGTSGAIFVAAIIMLCNFGRSFLPSFNEGSFTINVSTMPGVSLEVSDKIGRMAEQMLLSVPEIQTVGRKTGRAELDEHALGVNVSEIEAPYVLNERSKAEIEDEIRAKLKTIPGVNIEIGSPITHRIDAMLSGTRANIAIKLFGTDLNRMYAIAGQIRESVEDVEGIADLNVEQQVERPQLKIVPRYEMLARYGISIPEFANSVKVLLGGEQVSQVYEGNRNFDLTLKVKGSGNLTADDVKNLYIDANSGKIPLSHVAEVVSSTGPNTISRENVERKIVVSANVSGRDLRGAVNDMKARIEENIKLPEGYHIEYGGQFESEQAASNTIAITSVFSILAIFLLLFKEFRNLGQSLTVLLNLPLALIGGVASIWLSGGTMSIPSIIGFISLFGIATRNGMLLIDRYNSLRSSGLPLHECVIHGSLDRLNPILMTALTSGLALIPLAVGGELPGNEIQSPMAKVILGGLLTSTFLNGFIIPIMYTLLNRKSWNKESI